MFIHRIITSGDEKAVEEALVERHDGNAIVMKVGDTIMATVKSDGWAPADTAILSDLHQAGAIGEWQRFSEKG